ncbi:MAG: extracellular solute-binding protein [Melioribacteraceae bacterium]|nr:extracellular solute-binding protein [Melioribacteraceae bacterium]
MNINPLFRNKTLSYFSVISVISIAIFIFIYLIVPIKFSTDSGREEIVITYADNITEAHQTVVDNFNEEFKGKIRVEAINLPFIKFSTNERKELLTRSLRSKSDKLDVFAVDLIWSSRFAKWAEPLGHYITPQDTLSLVPQALESCKINNQLIALPMYLDIGVLYYRRDLIQELPNSEEIEEKLKNSITWEDFFELSKSFDQKINPFYIFPADNYEGLICSFYEILHNQNDKFFQKDTLDWKSEEVRNSILLLSSMINKYKISPQIVTDYRENSCYDYFIYNNGVFLRGWASFPKDSRALLESDRKAKLIEQAALPHIEGSKPVSTIGGWNIMLSKYSEHKEEAFEFIKYINKIESQKIFYKTGALLPVISSIYEDEVFIREHPDLLKNKELLDMGVHRPFLANYTKISDVLSFYTNKVMKNQLSVDSAITYTNKTLISGELILR